MYVYIYIWPSVSVGPFWSRRGSGNSTPPGFRHSALLISTPTTNKNIIKNIISYR